MSDVPKAVAPGGAATPSRSARAVTWGLCIALAVIALAVRVPGIGHGLPVAVEPDCKIPHQVELLQRGDDAWRSDREFRWYPLLIAYLAQQWPPPRAAVPNATLEEHLVAAAAPQLQTRFTVAMLAALMAPAAYLLAALFMERRWALVAGLLSAFSLLSLNFSQQSRPHAAAGAVFAWALLALVRVRHKSDVLGRGLAGGALAMAIGCLQSGIALLPALLTAALARKTHRRRLLDARWLVLLAPLALGVLYFYPFEFAGESVEPQQGNESTPLAQGGHSLFLEAFDGGGLRAIVRSLWSYEPVLFVLTLGGIALWIAARVRPGAPASDTFTRRRDLWVLLAFAAPYALVLAAYGRTYERFLIPLLPLMACASAFALRALARLVPTRSAAAGFATWAAFAALAIAPCAWLCWRLVSIRSAPHTTTLAARWLEEHAQELRGADIALTPQLDLPLAREREGFANWMPGGIEAQFTWVWSRYQAALPHGVVDGERWRLRWWRPKPVLMASSPEQYVREQGGDWLVAEVFADNRVLPAATKLRQWLLEHAQLQARFSPDADPHFSEHPMGYQDETSVASGTFFLRLAQARCAGPVIEIFRLPAR